MWSGITHDSSPNLRVRRTSSLPGVSPSYHRSASTSWLADKDIILGKGFRQGILGARVEGYRNLWLLSPCAVRSRVWRRVLDPLLVTLAQMSQPIFQIDYLDPLFLALSVMLKTQDDLISKLLSMIAVVMTVAGQCIGFSEVIVDLIWRSVEVLIAPNTLRTSSCVF